MRLPRRNVTYACKFTLALNTFLKLFELFRRGTSPGSSTVKANIVMMWILIKHM